MFQRGLSWEGHTARVNLTCDQRNDGQEVLLRRRCVLEPSDDMPERRTHRCAGGSARWNVVNWYFLYIIVQSGLAPSWAMLMAADHSRPARDVPRADTRKGTAGPCRSTIELQGCAGIRLGTRDSPNDESCFFAQQCLESIFTTE
jgi:hypothetical protein